MAKLMSSLSVAALSLLLISPALTTQYTVGDDLRVEHFCRLLRLARGEDLLFFSYVKGDHNVAMVDVAGCNNCNADSNYGVYDTGYDVFTLTAPGDVYFICTYHCDYADQKLKVTVQPSP
ncbi:hypothetical protein CRG98_003029 [Punica granatum]|uniref:Phytocyanin domain-containing protein n=1 Tax=Punica granatum TaxID=22663 RepID=A0A2I0L7F6_PUNGR|nr:hypothetical protein CRG98_003029 [Punica granatum]